MTDRIIIRLPGEPQAKGRHRSRLVQTKDGRRFINQYPDTGTAKYERDLRFAGEQAMGDRPLLTGPLSVTIESYRSIPASKPAWWQECALAQTIRPTTKPDADNIGKIIDALNKVVWVDDAQIVEKVIRKFYADKPELVIVVDPLHEPTREEAKRKPAEPINSAPLFEAEA